MSETDKINVDSIISRLLEVRGSRPGKAVQLTEAEIRGLCLKVTYISTYSLYLLKHGQISRIRQMVITTLKNLSYQ